MIMYYYLQDKSSQIPCPALQGDKAKDSYAAILFVLFLVKMFYFSIFSVENSRHIFCCFFMLKPASASKAAQRECVASAGINKPVNL